MPLLPERVLFVRRLRRFAPAVTAVVSVSLILITQLYGASTAQAAAANTVNFQARLQTASGAIVPDGFYNVEFKLYGASSGGTALWTEDYLNGSSQGLKTINGYLTANLGSITSFPSTINWDQQLWLTMNIGGTSTGSVTWDGEMSPRLTLTAVPFALSAGQLSTTTGSGHSTLTIQGSTSGDQNFVIQDQGAAGTYNLLTTNQANAGYIQLQGSTPGSAQTGNFNISGTGIAGVLQGSTAIKTPAIRPVTDGTSALQIENAAGSVTVLDVDTTNSRIGIGTTAPTASLSIVGATADDSSIALDVNNSAGGALITARNDGQVTIGTTATSGTSTTFGSMVTTTADSGNDSNFFASSKFTTGSNPGTLTSISIYVNAIDPTPANDKFRLGIYTDNAGKPGTRVAQSAEGTLSANTFNTLPVSASLSANTNYWLAYQTNGSGSGYNDFSYSSAASGTYYAYANPYGPFPATADQSSTTGSIALAIYGTYTEAGSSTTPAVVVAANGSVGIGGVTTPSTALQVQGTVAASALSLTGNGSATAFQAGLFDTASAGTLNIGTTNATSISLGNTVNPSTIALGDVTKGGTVITNGSAVFAAQALNNFTSNGAIGTAAATVDIHTSFTLNQTSSSITLSLPNPTDTTKIGRIAYVANVGSATTTVGSVTLAPGTSASFFWNGSNWISTAVSTGASVVGTFSSSSIANGASISGNTITFGAADGTNPGMVTASGTQTFGGTKVFSGTVSANAINAGSSNQLTIDSSGNLATTATVATAGFTNNGQTTFKTLALTDIAAGGNIGASAAATVDIYSSISIAQTTSGKTLTLYNPTASTTYGKLLYLSNIGSTAFTLLGTPLQPGATATLIWSNTSGGAKWQYAGSDGNSILNQTATAQSAGFNINGTGTAGTFNATTALQTGGTTRVDSSGNLTNIGNIAGSGTLQLSGTSGSSYIMSALGLGTSNPQSGAALTTANNSWIGSIDASGSGYINMFKVNGGNEIQVGAAMNVDGGIVLPTNGGQMTLSDLPIDSGASSGSKESYTMRVGSSNALTVYGESDGSGGVQNVRIAVGSSIAPAYTLDVGGDINTSASIRTSGTTRLDSSGNLTNVTYQGNAVAAQYGGTGQTSYTIGDLLYASGATTLSKLADVATGSCLKSGGVGVAPTWGTCVASGSFVTLQGSTPGTADTGNINVSGAIIAGSGMVASNLDTASAGTLTIAGTYATTVNIASNAVAHTVNVATGAAAQSVTIGSTNTSSSTKIQAGGSSVNVTNSAVAVTGTLQSASIQNLPGVGDTNSISFSSTSGISVNSVDGFATAANTLTSLYGGAYIMPSSASTVGVKIAGQTSQTGDLMQLTNFSNQVLSKFNSNGDLQIGSANAAASTTAFQVQNASGTSVLTADTSNSQVNALGLNIGGTANVAATGNLLNDGFENNSFAKWTAGSAGSPTVSTSVVRNGKYAANFSGTAQNQKANITANSTVYARAYVYFASQTTSGASLLWLASSAGTSYFQVYRQTDGTICLQDTSFGTSGLVGSCSGSLTLGAWHEVELRITTSTTVGQAQLWLDGTPIVSTAASQNYSATTIAQTWIGTGGGETANLYVDDVSVGTTDPGANADSLHVTGTSTLAGNVLVQAAANSTTAFQVQNSSGATLLAADTVNMRIDIKGSQSTATLGSNLLTNGNFGTNSCASWTCGSGWVATTGAAVHTAGNTGTLTQTITVTTGTTYQIDFTQTGSSAGSLNFSLGANADTWQNWDSNTHRTLVAPSSGSLTFTITPSSDFNGTVDNFSVAAITGTSIAVERALNSDGTVGLEMRSGGSASNNSFVGANAGQTTTTGSYDAALGTGALQSNTTGSYNAALGSAALQGNTTGTWNTGVGQAALYSNTVGTSNVAIGQDALYSNVNGNTNTVIGASAGYNNVSGYGNIFIGATAGFNETGNNKLYIANSSTSTPLIGGDFSGAQSLNINGNATFMPTSGNDSANAFKIQSSTSVSLFAVDSSAKRITIGTAGSSPTLLVFANKTDNTSDPTGVEGSMYYNAVSHSFRCYINSFWQDCATGEIDYSYNLTDDFFGGASCSNAACSSSASLGAMGWGATLVNGATNGSVNGRESTNASATHPGVLSMTTGTTSGVGLAINMSASYGLAVGQDYKSTIAVSNAGTARMLAGLFLINGAIDYTSTAPIYGVYWRAGATNWEYCYGNGSTGTCTSTGVAVAANSWARTEIRINALGSGTSNVDFVLNGTTYNVSNVTVADNSGGLSPNVACATNTGSARTCYIDYYQMRGYATSAR